MPFPPGVGEGVEVLEGVAGVWEDGIFEDEAGVWEDMEILEGVVFDAEETEGEIDSLMKYWMVHGKRKKTMLCHVYKLHVIPLLIFVF